MTHFPTVRLLEVEGTPKNIDLEGVTLKIPGIGRNLGVGCWKMRKR